MNNTIKETWQLNSILDIYNGKENNQNIGSAEKYYLEHNSIPNGVILSDKITPINGIHKISNAYYYFEENDYLVKPEENNRLPYSKFYPILITYDTNHIENNYKLLSAKDIDYENAYLKYAKQKHNYHDPIEFYELSLDQNGQLSPNHQIDYTYVFDREITPYINNSYDLLNVVDYLFNRINCLSYLLNIIKDQKNISDNLNNKTN